MTKTKQEKMLLAFSIALAGMEIAQHYRPKRSKLDDKAIMYLKAAITELHYGENADMQIVYAAWKKQLDYMGKSAQKRQSKKQFPPGGIISNRPPGEPEYIIPTKKP